MNAHIIGVVVRDTSIAITIAVYKVMANSRNTRPTIPAINRIGMNTAISDMLMERMVNPISRDPSKAARLGAMPVSRRREIFSTTTIASSTTNPVEMVNAISERLSMLKPSRYITANVPINEAGTATAGISVARQLRRNMNTTSTTSTTEPISERSTSLTEARMVVVRSSTTVVLMPCGIEATIDGNSAL